MKILKYLGSRFSVSVTSFQAHIFIVHLFYINNGSDDYLHVKRVTHLINQLRT